MVLLHDTKCTFTITEINHDLNPPVTAKELKEPQFQTEILSGSGSFCNALQPSSSFLNDASIVERIFGMTPELLRTDESIVGSEKTIPVCIINPKTGELDKQGEGRAQAKIIRYKKPYGPEIMRLFEHNDFVFTITDTGDNLIQVLKSLQLFPQNRVDGEERNNGIVIPNIYAIHSAPTLSDSARKTVPDAPKYDTKNKKGIRLYSYYDINPFNVYPDDKLFMSNFRIDSQLDSSIQRPWAIRQKWSDSQTGNIISETTDPKKDNNKETVRKNIRSEPHNVLIHSQKKRSGDHFQIAYAKQFPRRIHRDPSKFIYVRGPKEGGTYGGDDLTTIPSKNNKRWYRQRTYLLTGDWPALAYAAANQINTIMIFKHPRKKDECTIIRIFFAELITT